MSQPTPAACHLHRFHHLCQYMYTPRNTQTPAHQNKGSATARWPGLPKHFLKCTQCLHPWHRIELNDIFKIYFTISGVVGRGKSIFWPLGPQQGSKTVFGIQTTTFIVEMIVKYTRAVYLLTLNPMMNYFQPIYKNEGVIGDFPPSGAVSNHPEVENHIYLCHFCRWTKTNVTI